MHCALVKLTLYYSLKHESCFDSALCTLQANIEFFRTRLGTAHTHRHFHCQTDPPRQRLWTLDTRARRALRTRSWSSHFFVVHQHSIREPVALDLKMQLLMLFSSPLALVSWTLAEPGPLSWPRLRIQVLALRVSWSGAHTPIQQIRKKQATAANTPYILDCRNLPERWWALPWLEPAKDWPYQADKRLSIRILEAEIGRWFGSWLEISIPRG